MNLSVSPPIPTCLRLVNLKAILIWEKVKNSNHNWCSQNEWSNLGKLGQYCQRARGAIDFLCVCFSPQDCTVTKAHQNVHNQVLRINHQMPWSVTAKNCSWDTHCKHSACWFPLPGMSQGGNMQRSCGKWTPTLWDIFFPCPKSPKAFLHTVKKVVLSEGLVLSLCVTGRPERWRKIPEFVLFKLI